MEKFWWFVMELLLLFRLGTKENKAGGRSKGGGEKRKDRPRIKWKIKYTLLYPKGNCR